MKKKIKELTLEQLMEFIPFGGVANARPSGSTPLKKINDERGKKRKG